MRDGKNFADLLDTIPRRLWTYPMRITPDSKCYSFPLCAGTDAGVDLSSFYPGSTDMVRMWEALGFVTRIEIPQQLPIYVEVQRLLPTDTGGDIVPKDRPLDHSCKMGVSVSKTEPTTADMRLPR